MNDLEKQKSIINFLSYPVSIKDGNLQYIYCNHAFEVFMEVKVDDIIGKSDRELFSESIVKLLSQLDLDCMTYAHIRHEATMCVDESCATEVIIYLNRMDVDGDIEGVISSFIDITELKTIEEGLSSDHDIVNSILDTQSNFIIVTDGVFIKSVNKALLQFLGVNDLAEFNEKFYCLSEVFEPIKGFYHIEGSCETQNSWIEGILDLAPQDRVVAMSPATSELPFYFSVRLNALEAQANMYVVSFDDITELTQQSQSYQFAANHDELTGLFNKAYFQTYLPSVIKTHNDNNSPLSMIMFDIDFFKKINDGWGHLIGDDVLRELSNVIKNSIRSSDSFFRWGGEEFIIILQGCSLSDAVENAEVLRQRVEQHQFESIKSLTCSFGVVSYKTGEESKSFVDRLDQQLYNAKKDRNCVCSQI